MKIRCKSSTTLDLFDRTNRHQSVEFFKQLREAGEGENLDIFVDLSSTERIFPSGALFLLAEIYKAKYRPGSTNILRSNRARSPLVDQVFKQIGVYELLDVECDVKPDDETVKHWKYATGTLSDGQQGGSIIERYEGRLPERLSRGLYGGIVEAMTNTVHHAYLGPEGKRLSYGLGRRWWMLSQEKDQKLTVAICDLGIGIPRSLPLSKTFSADAIKRLWQGLGLARNDGNAIKVALQLGQTRTNQKGRGRGLSEIVAATDLSRGGNVLISSNRGLFTQSADGGNTHTDSHSIRGTLVTWTVPIDDTDEPIGD